MIPDNFQTLIEKLKDKTAKQETVWSKTSREDEYKLDLGKGAITVDRWTHPETGEELVDMVILNERGDIIDNIVFSSEAKDEYKYLGELHSIVKRAYHKVDETFKSIFKELDSDKTIGIEKKDIQL